MENSILLAFILILIRLFSIFSLKKMEKRYKNDPSHYEAIADEHMRKMYNPVKQQIHAIICLLFAGFTLPIKIFIILYVIWCIFEKIGVRLILLQHSLDLLSLKQGLISMYLGDSNAYRELNFPNSYVEIKENRIFYIVNNKIVNTFCININGLSEQEIKQFVYWHEQKLKDYLKYIPKEVLLSENLQDKFDYWFTYLEDVHANY